MLPAWREATVYTDAERAALALTEAVTLIAAAHVPADVEDEARRLFDAETYAALVFAIALINTWNRLAITAHREPGHYHPPPARPHPVTRSERVGECVELVDRDDVGRQPGQLVERHVVRPRQGIPSWSPLGS